MSSIPSRCAATLALLSALFVHQADAAEDYAGATVKINETVMQNLGMGLNDLLILSLARKRGNIFLLAESLSDNERAPIENLQRLGFLEATAESPDPAYVRLKPSSKGRALLLALERPPTQD